MKPLDYLLAAVKQEYDREVHALPEKRRPDIPLPVFCGFVPGTVFVERYGQGAAAGIRVAGTNTLPAPDAARECVILHMEDAVPLSYDSQATPGTVQIEIEVRLAKCEDASDLVDTILDRLERDAVLMAVMTRYDEPGVSELGYGAHSAVVILPGNCPYLKYPPESEEMQDC